MVLVNNSDSGGAPGTADAMASGSNSGASGATTTAAVVPRTRAAAAREWLRAGFFAALGVALLALAALVTWRLTRATLAVISPFVFAMVLALLLDPLADRLERRGLGRAAAVGVVFGGFVLLFAGLIALAVPPMIAQASQLAENGPQYVERFRSTVDEWLAGHRRVGSYPLPENFDALVAELSQRASLVVRNSAGRVTAVLIGSVGTLLQTVVTLIVTFYLLLDIDRLRARLFYLLPERTRGPAGQMASDIGEVFSDYLRGLLIVCALYGAVTIVLLYGLGFVQPEMRQYALLVGALAGLLYAVPYVGALVTALITFLVGFAAGGAAFGGIAAGSVVVLNQVFDNVVTPRVVGGGVGLHPVAAVFALVLGGELFGLWGLLLSVPLAASVQVILFRLFPKLTTPTPRAFLRAQGIHPSERESAKILEGDEREVRPGGDTPTPIP
jgi:predicted PurR-regulated permease PerM